MIKLPNLNGLRFFLASLVVIYHVPQFCYNRGLPFFNSLSIFEKGDEAVFMFFSLSGFLIIRQLYLQKSVNNTINLKSFFVRRALRIFPLYYLILTFGLVYYRLILPSFGFDFKSNYDLIQGIFLSYSFFPNIFSTFQPGGIIEALWSIGIEEQFYLFIAPLLFFLPVKHILRFLLFFTLAYFVLYFSSAIVFLEKFKMLFFYFSFSGVCSILMLKNKINLQKFTTTIIIVFILYFTTALFKSGFSTMLYHLFSMILFGIVLCVLSDKPITLMENKILNHLGKISYGIYMYHAIMLQIVGFLFLKLNPESVIKNLYSILLFNFLVFAFTIVIAHLSYKYFESFFLNFKNKYQY